MSHERKKEVIGLMLMVLSGLTALALVSYSAADMDIARTFTLERVLNPSENRAVNLLGPVGAVLSDLLVFRFLGYFSLLLTGVVFAWGYVVFRRKRPVSLPFVSVLAIAGAFVLSMASGWVILGWELDAPALSGVWGIAAARWMIGLAGTVGAGGILLLLLATLSLLTIKRDIQATVDRIEGWAQTGWDRLHDYFQRWYLDFRDRWTERKLGREADRDAVVDEAVSPPRAPREVPGLNIHAGSSDGKIERDSSPAQHANGYVPPARKHSVDAVEDGVSIVKPEPVHFDRSGGVAVHVQQQVREEEADPGFRKAVAPPAHPPYRFPSIDLLDETDHSRKRVDFSEIEENNQILLDKLATYSIDITNINAIVGPTVTMYELTPAPGVKISRITALENDLAMAMAARGIRIIAPIPGKSAVGVEIPNRHRELVRVRDIIGTARFQDSRMELPVAIGKAIDGEVFVEDLARMPHLLIAGATGSGKSVGLNTLIVGLLYACHPKNLKFVMIDPKKIELQQYAQIFDHFAAMPPHSEDPIITDFTEALGVLKCCEKEMELRYDLLSDASVRGVKEYNERFATGKLDAEMGHRHLPYIVLIVDELADLMMTAGKEIEGPIARLAQMARAVGIHLVLATQRPSVDVITGLIKANFPSRIAYQVASKVDSRTILDQNGAEGLVGNGDLLYMNGSRVVRLQGPFVSVDEVEEVMRFIGDQSAAGPYLLPPIEENGGGHRETEVLEDTDDLFDEAARIIVRSQQGSVSLLQRRLSVGYTRAARIVDQLEDAGVVGPFEGSKARRVLIESELQLDEFLASRK